jgi:hypothetical protein
VDLNRLISSAGQEKTAAALESFLASYANPSFGVLPKAEIDLLVVKLLIEIGGIPDDPGAYELASVLKVTSAKARSLVYARSLRIESPITLESRLRKVLSRPIVQKAGEVFVLDVENPVVLDYLKSKVRMLGYLSDGSFSPNVVKLSLDAMSALIEEYIPLEHRVEVQKALVKAGAPDTTLKGVLKAVMRQLGSKVASASGDALMDRISEYMTPLLSQRVGEVIKAGSLLLSGATKRRE